MIRALINPLFFLIINKFHNFLTIIQFNIFSLALIAVLPLAFTTHEMKVQLKKIAFPRPSQTKNQTNATQMSPYVEIGKVGLNPKLVHIRLEGNLTDLVVLGN